MGEGWPKFDLFPRIAHVGRAIGRFVLGPHLFSSVSDHEFRHPLDPPEEPVVDWPGESDGISTDP